MPTLTADCPRCRTVKSTFDMLGKNHLYTDSMNGWVTDFEIPAVCRHCSTVTVHRVRLREHSVRAAYAPGETWPKTAHLNDFFAILGYVSLKDKAAVQPPDHVPEDIAAIFREGSTCQSLDCFNAAGAMFRLCLDMATKDLLPDTETPNGPNRNQRTRLYDRLEWLFNSGTLPDGLKELASCVREDGNDAAHDGTLAKVDAEDLLDFSRILLERIYTEPARLREARERREQRRA